MAVMTMARPTKFDAKVAEQILQAVRVGCYIETAAAYAGISKQTLYNWLKIGARRRTGPLHDFHVAFERALAQAEMRDLVLISKAAEEQWQAAAWRLERKFPDRWGRRERHDVNLGAEDGAVIRVTIGGKDVDSDAVGQN